jgi:hypothetical protein
MMLVRRFPRLDQHHVVADFAEQQEPIVTKSRNSGQRGVDEPLPGGRTRARFQAQLRMAKRSMSEMPIAAGAHLVTDLLGMRTNPAAQRRHRAGKSGIE